MKKLLLVLMLSAAGWTSAAPAVIPLWPEGVPGQRNIGPEKVGDGYTSNVSEPALTMIGPAVDHPNGTAVIICPGGGYIRMATAREGDQYATWLSTLGVTSFVLKYRMQEFGHPAPLQDVLRAVRMLRSRAAEFGIRPDRIGAMGSSAGGHLAASAGTLFDHPLGRTGGALDSVSARPDFLMLMYPVITMQDPAAHAGSRKALLGVAPSAELLNLMSLEKQVTAATPPTLLIHTQADTAVPVDNSILFYQALTKNKVPAEMYLLEHGGHGMGMRDGLGTSSLWPRRAEEWLRDRGLLNQAK
ncbi:Acetyl esterase/lipase [Duganella sp. CF402]|uniref:alpha/beta hydrolase n=1 Tax=unclassified Duganella TaxID=2636909 RepID=UPI0008D65C0C|nr:MULTISPECIES: alpha/beta hydrolase [unclassified Duganella]RZT10486.1 acetyl esterase/lipase [Duganella sp. BK701]SEL11093.1 Acetyl esterase/lipase [Duganella sp. CF402]